ncbi:hypothetical protein QYR09_15915 [Cellulophaga lytica]|nr:hypothetical protein QYR09_15915 [Cellulophaga lytica]
MSNFRNRPADNYINEANWQQLFLLTKHWKSDLLFYKDDLRFLHQLIKNTYCGYLKRKT